MAERVGVFRYAFQQGFRDPLPLIVLFEQLFIVGIGNEADLSQDGWHRSADEDHKRRFANATVVGIGVHFDGTRGEGFVYLLRKFFRLFQFGLQNGFFQQIV